MREFISRKINIAALSCFALTSQIAQADETLTLQQGENGYTGATSVIFNGGRAQTDQFDSHYFRYDGTLRRYNIEHFQLPDLSTKGEITSAKLSFYYVGGSFTYGSDIYVRQILDPDNLGAAYATGWKVGNGFRAGANLESRDDTATPDVKWRLSDPDSPDDLNADYFQGVLRPLAESPFFTPISRDPHGTQYQVDVTSDLQCIQSKLCANQGWALYHELATTNIAWITANSRHAESQYRPKLELTFAPYVDTLEPLVIKSYPNDDLIYNPGDSISLTLTTNEAAQCKFDLSPVASYEQMRFAMNSSDGISHHGSWPAAAINTRYQLFGKCIDETGNASQTPHVYTFTITDEDPGNGETGGGETGGGETGGGETGGGETGGGETGGGETGGGETGGGTANENYEPIDLLPGVNPEDVWLTLYAIAGEDLIITLGDALASDGNPYTYEVSGHNSCATSVVANQCTFNNTLPSTQLLTVTFTSGANSTSHKIAVVTQQGNTGISANYVTGQEMISPDYGLTPPAKGESRVDPVTGVTITRLTDASEFPETDDALIVYSRYSPENSSGKYVLIFGDKSTSSWVINRESGAQVAKLVTDSGNSIGEIHEVRWDNSGRHPDRVYYRDGMKFWMIDDIADQENTRVLIKDFSALFPNSTKIYNDVEGDSSNDSDHWVWMAVHYDYDLGTFLVDAYVHYQISTDTVHTLKPADLAGTNLDIEKDKATFSLRPNMVEMSPLGTGIMIHHIYKWDNSAYGGDWINYIGTWFDGAHVWPVDFDFTKQAPIKVASSSSHSGWSFGEDYREMFVSQNTRTDGMDAVYVLGENSGYDNRIETINQREYGYNSSGFHFGKMPINKPGWLFMSTYSTNHETWGKNQLMMIQTKPAEENPVIFRLGHTYTKFEGAYRDEAAAAINHTGNRIYWTSNWGGHLDHREAFMMELPDNWDKELSK